MTKRFYQSISSLTHAIRDAGDQIKNGFEWCRSRHDPATKQDLKEMERLIMDTIKNFAESQNAYNERLHVAIDDLTEDVKNLHDDIEKLKAGIGPTSPENKAILEKILQDTESVTTKAETLASLTPPKPPVEEPEA